jgi:MoaA/NifB/PqqE/SkfB family radical SAM enzyme
MQINSLEIAYTNSCTSKCRHCCKDASLEQHEKLYPDEILVNLPIFQKYGIRGIIYSGGEPLVYFDEIEEIAKEILKLKWHQTIFTNAHWAKTKESTNKSIARFNKMGINHIIISTSEYHMEFVNFSTLKNALILLNESKIKVTLRILRNGRINFEFLALLIRLQKIAKNVMYDYLCSTGRASSLPEAENMKQPNNCVLKNKCGLMNQIYINQNGELMRCQCVAQRYLSSKQLYYFGNIRKDDLNSMLTSINKYNNIYDELKTIGPGGIYLKLKHIFDKNGFMLKEKYDSYCELCSHLLGNYKYFKLASDNLNN